MTLRSRQALHAALWAAFLAALTTSILLIVTGKMGDIFFLVPPSALACFATTWISWRWFFTPTSGGLLRAVGVGVLIVIVSMFVMMAGLGLFLIDNLGAIFSGMIMGFFGLMLFGLVLIPLGIVYAVLIRWFQMRHQPTGEGDETDYKSPGNTREGWSIAKRLWIGLGSVVLLGAIAFAAFMYFAFSADEVTLSSTSPSGNMTFSTREGCLGHACWHNGEIRLNNGGRLKGYSEPCNLHIIADFPYFTSGSRFTWNADETIVTWYSTDHESGTVDLRKDCARMNIERSPSLNKVFYIREQCLFGSCRRELSLRVQSTNNLSKSKTHDCTFFSAHEKNLFTAENNKLVFSWGTDENTLEWRTKSPKRAGVIDLIEACNLKAAKTSSQ